MNSDENLNNEELVDDNENPIGKVNEPTNETEATEDSKETTNNKEVDNYVDEPVENIKQEIVVEDFEITMSMNMNYIVKINNNMVENLICNFNGNNVVYQTNVTNNELFMDNLEYCRAVEQKFKEKVNVMAEKLNYVQRLA